MRMKALDKKVSWKPCWSFDEVVMKLFLRLRQKSNWRSRFAEQVCRTSFLGMLVRFLILKNSIQSLLSDKVSWIFQSGIQTRSDEEVGLQNKFACQACFWCCSNSSDSLLSDKCPEYFKNGIETRSDVQRNIFNTKSSCRSGKKGFRKKKLCCFVVEVNSQINDTFIITWNKTQIWGMHLYCEKDNIYNKTIFFVSTDETDAGKWYKNTPLPIK